jgi:hypothetical protein
LVRAAAALTLGLVALLALPAWSANVKDVRVGRHPEFTRIVFELDEQAGYRIKRSDRDLVVTVEATSGPWTLGRNGGIESVKVERTPTQSIVRIRLRESGLRLHEMILANPPRIVLDLRSPQSGQSEKPVARAETVKPAPAAPPKPKPEPRRAAAPPAPKPAPKPAATPPAPEKPVARTETVKPAPDSSLDDDLAEPMPAFATPVRRETARPKPPEETPTQARTTAPVRPAVAPKPKPAPATASDTGMFEDPRVLGGIAAAAVVLIALVVVVLRRRRSIPNDLDITSIGDDSDGSSQSSVESSSVEGFSMDDPTTLGSAASDSADDDFFGDLDSPTTTSGAATGTAATPPASSGSSIFDGDGSAPVADKNQGDATMDQNISDLPTSAAAAASSPAASGDIARIVQDLEARLSAVEAKLEEANEARERLERQAAAQSEELRVQRAAIARTQRALRSMSRGDEDKATEPALRDADTQMKTRVNG